MRSISRRTCLALLATCGSGIWLTTQVGQATEIEVTLQARLEKDLRARRPQEFAFIARVIVLVDTGKLPRADVERLYLWARRQPDHRFQYFQFALEKVAAKLGIVI